jgi:hypothetical protein
MTKSTARSRRNAPRTAVETPVVVTPIIEETPTMTAIAEIEEVDVIEEYTPEEQARLDEINKVEAEAAEKEKEVIETDAPVITEVEAPNAPVVAPAEPEAPTEPETPAEEPKAEVPAAAPVVVKVYPTALKQIAAVFLACPKKNCGHAVLSPEGDMALDESIAGPGHIIKCTKCGTEFKTPKSAFIY